MVIDGELTTGHEVCTEYCNDYPMHTAYVNALFTETYCSMIIGYQKKIVKVLTEDAALVAAKAAKEAQEDADKIAKEKEKKELEASIDACMNLDPDTAKTKDIVNCVIPVLQYIRKHM
jgi:hypothetical protein